MSAVPIGRESEGTPRRGGGREKEAGPRGTKRVCVGTAQGCSRVLFERVVREVGERKGVLREPHRVVREVGNGEWRGDGTGQGCARGRKESEKAEAEGEASVCGRGTGREERCLREVGKQREERCLREVGKQREERLESESGEVSGDGREPSEVAAAFYRLAKPCVLPRVDESGEE